MTSTFPGCGTLRIAACLALCGVACGPLSEPEDTTGVHYADPAGVGRPGFASPQVQSVALSPDGAQLYVSNTAAGTLDIIDTDSREVSVRIGVGVNPGSVAVRPDGSEVWVSNHLSDSVSVVDVAEGSETRYRVVATIQQWREGGLVTAFDEPSSIAFASDDKAYVALTSRNRIAVVDVASREVTGHIQVLSQEPRALTVRDGKLYVIPFESGNQTELSGCASEEVQLAIAGEVFAPNTEDCTFDVVDVLLGNGRDAILTRNFPANIIRNPRVPDRDLFIYDTSDESLVEEVSTIGTLLYGIAVDSTGRVFIAQTEARNDENGELVDGHDLEDIENRMFLNQIARVDCDGGCAEPKLIDLDPELPLQPTLETALATPFGIQVSGDDATIVAVAASSSRLFTMDADSGDVLGLVDLGGVPKSLVLESNSAGEPRQAWVFNAIENSISLVDVSDPAAPSEVVRIALEDPTPADFKRGRLAFNNAAGSTSASFSCESCHPDGNTDQILWNLGAKCVTEGCDQKIPRTTMPIRGLRDTLPLHWDGVLADPFGGSNGELADSGTVVDPTCSDEVDCFRDVVDESLLGTMCDFNTCPDNGEGLPGALSVADRDAMARFLMAVPYPPARSRQVDDELSDLARAGMREFFVGSNVSNPGCARAGMCHGPPFLAGTNTDGNGMDAPTFRGLTDRYLILPNGRTNLWDILRSGNSEVDWDPQDGPNELYSFGFVFGTAVLPGPVRGSNNRGPDELWQLFEETSTGFSGAFGRQLTLDAATSSDEAVAGLMGHLETAAQRGVVALRGTGVWLDEGRGFTFSYEDGAYIELDGQGKAGASLSPAELRERATDGKLLATLTAFTGSNVGIDHGQPGIWTGPVESGPTLAAGQPLGQLPNLAVQKTISLYGLHLDDNAIVLIDGAAVEAALGCTGDGELPECDSDAIDIELAQSPAEGDHTLQLVTRGGLTSNEIMVTVGEELAADPVSCGGVACATVDNPGGFPLCCTAEGTGQPGHEFQDAGRGPDLCGVDIGSLVPELTGLCLQLAQPGERTEDCPEVPAPTGNQDGCCMATGVCGGFVGGAVGLGCVAAGPNDPIVECTP